MKAKELMSIEPTTASPDDTLHDLLWSFTKCDHHNIYVKDENDDLVGVVSEFDILGSIVPKFTGIDLSLAHMMAEGFFEKKGHELKDKKAKDLMRKDFTTIDEDAPIIEAAAKILHKRIFDIPVVKDKKLLGVLYRGHLLDHLAKVMFSNKDKDQ